MTSVMKNPLLFLRREKDKHKTDPKEGPPFCLETAARTLGGSTVAYLQPGLRGLTEDQYQELVSFSTTPLPQSTTEDDVAAGNGRSTAHLKMDEFYNRTGANTVRCLCLAVSGRRDGDDDGGFTPGIVRVFFRGTDSFGNVLADGKILRVPHPPERGTPLINQPAVHRGFLNAWRGDELREQVIDFVLKHASRLQREAQEAAIDRKEEPEPIIVEVAGHSLGGSVAVLASYDLAVALKENDTDKDTGSCKPEVRLYTFGCPRVGNSSFVKDFNRVVPHCWNVINSNDVVPSVPHASLVLKDGWTRHGRTVIIEEDGTMIVDPSLDVKRARERRVLNVASCATSHETGSYRASLRAVFEKEGLLDPDDPANAKAIALDARFEKLSDIIAESRAEPRRSFHVLPGAT